MSGTVLAVTSGKGGVGKSTTALNLGAALNADGHAVALIDADLGMANIGDLLEVRTESTLHDVLAGRSDVDSAVVSGQAAMDVVPGGRDLTAYAEADPGRLPGVLATLAESYEYVVVDTGAGLGYADVVPVEAADEVILVTTPTDPAVGDTAKLAAFSDRVDARIRGVVVTRANEATDAEAVATNIGADLLGVVPEDPRVPGSADAGVPLERHAPDSPASVAYRRLARVVSERSPGFERGVVEFSGGTTEEGAGTPTEAPDRDTEPSAAVEDSPVEGETADADAVTADEESAQKTSGGLLARLRRLV
jgi:septum site-determining protein MinD